MSVRSTLQSCTGCFLHDAGTSWESISKQAEQYEKFKVSCIETGKLIPLANGVLIFDEVKVISWSMRNSRSQMIIGLAMNARQTS